MAGIHDLLKSSLFLLIAHGASTALAAKLSQKFSLQGLISSLPDGNYPMMVTFQGGIASPTLSVASVPVSGGIFTLMVDDSSLGPNAFLSNATGNPSLSIDLKVDVNRDGGYAGLFAGIPVSTVPSAYVAHTALTALTANVANSALTATTATSAGTATTAGTATSATSASMADNTRAIQGVSVDLTGVSTGNVLKYQSGKFVPAVDATGSSGPTYSAGVGIVISSANLIRVDTGASAYKIPILDGTGKLDSGIIPSLNSSQLGASIINTSHLGDSQVTDAKIYDVASSKIKGSILSLGGSTVASELRWKAPASASYVAIKSPNTLSSNVEWVLPASQGSAGQVLTNDGSGGLSWANDQVGSSNSGLASFNGLTGSVQTLVVSTAGSDVSLSSSGSTHTLALPSASASTRGVLSSADWAAFNAKASSADVSSRVLKSGDTLSGALQVPSLTVVSGLTASSAVLTGIDPNRILLSDANRQITSATISVGEGELAALSGVTSLIQTQLNNLGTSLSAWSASFVAKSGDSMTGDLSFAPAAKLVVSSGSLSSPAVMVGGSSLSGIYAPQTGVLGLVGAGSERLRVSSGNVAVMNAVLTLGVSNGTSATIDFSNSNTVVSTAACASNMEFAGLRDGGEYNLILSTPCSFVSGLGARTVSKSWTGYFNSRTHIRILVTSGAIDMIATVLK